MSWWDDLVSGTEDLFGFGGDAGGNIGQEIGEGIATGVETAFVAFLRDLWDVVVGPLEVVIGCWFLLMGFQFAFASDLASIARLLL